jgi:hypothetical protein
MAEICCANCRFFSATISQVSALKYVDGIGECRRNAPRGPVALAWAGADEPDHQHRAVMSPFPFMPADDWCGEFQPNGRALEEIGGEDG